MGSEQMFLSIYITVSDEKKYNSFKIIAVNIKALKMSYIIM